MSLLDEADILCPYCGEIITVLVDASAGSQHYVEDCQVCCSPIVLNIDIDEDRNIHISPQQEYN